MSMSQSGTLPYRRRPTSPPFWLLFLLMLLFLLLPVPVPVPVLLLVLLLRSSWRLRVSA
jgi:hypothetical protein